MLRLMSDRTVAAPVTLVFVRARGRLLLLRVRAGKPFGGLLNGLGGHVHPGEDVRQAALREVQEESGLTIGDVSLRLVLHEVGLVKADRMVFVFTAELDEAYPPTQSAEGEVGWYGLDSLPWVELVPDLREILPRVLAARDVLFGTVEFDREGDEGAYRLTIG